MFLLIYTIIGVIFSLAAIYLLRNEEHLLEHDTEIGLTRFQGALVLFLSDIVLWPLVLLLVILAIKND